MTIYWKRFEALVTGLYNKYWQDAFFRTECNIIALQIAFATVLFMVVTATFNNLYKSTLSTIFDTVTANISKGGQVNGQELFTSIQAIKMKDSLILLASSIIISLIFSYIIARVTLTPTRQALRSQKRFISDIAHELRTPLAVIKTNTEVALLEHDTQGNVMKIFKSNIEELDRASEIINNLLTFNNLIRPEKIKFSSIDLGVASDRVLKNLHKLAHNKNIKITSKKNPPYTVWGNATGLEQIISNILKNAISYTPSGGNVTIEVEPDYKNNVIFRVTDTGIGIPEKDLLHIFEPFYRAETSRNRQSGSSGLGLAIVSELLKIHNGKITIKSRPNHGTIVTVYLPFALPESESGPIWNYLKPDSLKHIDEVSIDFLKK